LLSSIVIPIQIQINAYEYEYQYEIENDINIIKYINTPPTVEVEKLKIFSE